MDAITLLKADHRAVQKLFKQFEKSGDRAVVTKRNIVKDIVKELSIHAAIEEQVFYPSVRNEVDGAEREVLESLEEHHVAKWLLSEIDGMSPDDERFDAKVTVLIEAVRHHVEEEETVLFPEVRAALGRKRLGEIGEVLAKAKAVAPTRPHPRSPDSPPANIVSGVVSGAVDRLRSTVKGEA